MGELFAWEYSGEPFHLFSTPHLAALATIVVLNVSLLWLRKHPRPGWHRSFRLGLAAILLVNEAAWHLWIWASGQWTIQTMLPLHLCSVMVFLSVIMLITRSQKIYEVAYFLGIGGATQALLTPPLTIHGFPHFRFFQTFIAHGGIITASVYMTIVEHYRPYPRSMGRVFIGMNLFMLFVGVVNTLIGSNYLYLAHKPDIPTLIDKLGPWPWYIIPMEAIGVLMILVLYAPFALYDWRKDRAHRPGAKGTEA